MAPEQEDPSELILNPMNNFELEDSEILVFQRIIRGMTNDQIAEDLGLATQTIKNSVSSIFQKAKTSTNEEVSSRAALIAVAIRHGEIFVVEE